MSADKYKTHYTAKFSSHPILECKYKQTN